MSSKIDGMLNLQIGLLEWNRSQPKPPITQGYEYGVATAAFDIFQEYAPPELAELQATIAQLTAERDQLKSLVEGKQGSLGKMFELKEKYRLELERLKGGQGAPVAWIKPDVLATLRKDECCYAFGEQSTKGNLVPLFASQPAPVSVRLPERIEPPSDYAYRKGWNACLDKVKELNQ